MNTPSDVYSKITSSIIEAIEAGCGQFTMPWQTAGSLPINAATQRRYRGVNILALWAASAKAGHSSQLWATYQQWSELGAQVRKGERSTAVVFWKFKDQNTTTEQEPEKEKSRRSCFARAYQVFNLSQVDGYQAPDIALMPETARIERAEEFFRRTSLPILERGSRAYYDSRADEIVMPPFSLFRKADYFYSVLAHEAAHATGHGSRCDRQLANRFGSEAYAMEELIAELGSAFLAADLELETEPTHENAPYIQNWLKALKGDNRAIFTAAAKAQEAADWLNNTQEQETTP